MVEFDLTSDGRFQASLHDLGAQGELDVLEAIADILDQHLGWNDFVAKYGWEPVTLHGENTYPGAIELFTFALQGQSGQFYQVVASTINRMVVVCAVARRFLPLP